ncbi:MAG: protoheme IX farnesyltransferase [Verrucomicrobia bacterium]|nr:protoheme IX farnesyltransferase [Verrucomicrobiota bacterium]
MKATVAVLPSFPRVASRAADFIELAKPRLNSMVLVTTATGFYLGARGVESIANFDWVLALNALIGTFLTAGGSAALNMLLERETDARMRRTQDRPLPSGRVTPAEALVFGSALVAAGLTWLALATNALATLLAALTVAVYLFAYTPLKTRTPLCTVVGAVPGAVPPMIGWAAARGALDGGAWALFAIMFFWQLPHFLAIAWFCREDYARAGLPMLSVLDPDGSRTARHAIGSTVGLALVSLAPVMIGLAGFTYGAGALVLGAVFLACGFRLRARRDMASARALFAASLVYLPLVLCLMLWDRVVS